jgi:hypothetical protein
MAFDGFRASNRFYVLWMGLGMIAGITLFCFDPSRYHFYPVCIFHQTTGLLCPGCGSLRALYHLLHGRIAIALHFNLLLVLSLPLIAAFTALWFLKERRNQSSPLPARVVWAGLIAMLLIGLAFGVWRNLPGSPLAMLPP